MTVDARIHASYVRARDRVGVPITIRRVTGDAPNAVVTNYALKAIVQSARPDPAAEARTGYGSGKLGGMTQADRRYIVLQSDMDAVGFPSPLQEGDTIIMDPGGRLAITLVDAQVRALAGVIEFHASGNG